MVGGVAMRAVATSVALMAMAKHPGRPEAPCIDHQFDSSLSDGEVEEQLGTQLQRGVAGMYHHKFH